jgi:hypothetical protein
MARTKFTHLAREKYDDIEVAIKELGTLWVLDAVNRNLALNRRRKEEMREKRADDD